MSPNTESEQNANLTSRSKNAYKPLKFEAQLNPINVFLGITASLIALIVFIFDSKEQQKSWFWLIVFAFIFCCTMLYIEHKVDILKRNYKQYRTFAFILTPVLVILISIVFKCQFWGCSNCSPSGKVDVNVMTFYIDKKEQGEFDDLFQRTLKDEISKIDPEVKVEKHHQIIPSYTRTDSLEFVSKSLCMTEGILIYGGTNKSEINQSKLRVSICTIKDGKPKVEKLGNDSIFYYTIGNHSDIEIAKNNLACVVQFVAGVFYLANKDTAHAVQAFQKVDNTCHIYPDLIIYNTEMLIVLDSSWRTGQDPASINRLINYCENIRKAAREIKEIDNRKAFAIHQSMVLENRLLSLHQWGIESFTPPTTEFASGNDDIAIHPPTQPTDSDQFDGKIAPRDTIKIDTPINDEDLNKPTDGLKNESEENMPPTPSTCNTLAYKKPQASKLPKDHFYKHSIIINVNHEYTQNSKGRQNFETKINFEHEKFRITFVKVKKENDRVTLVSISFLTEFEIQLQVILSGCDLNGKRITEASGQFSFETKNEIHLSPYAPINPINDFNFIDQVEVRFKVGYKVPFKNVRPDNTKPGERH